MLSDVPFTEYATNSLAAQAVADMNNLSFLRSSANNQFPYPVTPQNLFRGQFVPGDGNVRGPYISQFMIQPTFFGAQPLDQKYQTFLPVGGGGSDYMTSASEYQMVQNGGDSGRTLAFDPTFRYVRNGRDLAAYTHVDVLYQGYLVAFLVLAGMGAAPNPGNPYIGSLTQKAFATLGGPDAAGTLAEMATRALKAAWFHKWIKDLRMRPEEYGALVHAWKTNASPMPQAAAALHSDVLNSAALPIINSNYGSYFLPQAFPEGSPTHPCYPTGHGTVGGACITVLKFFFNGSLKIRPLLAGARREVYEPSADGLSLDTYTGADRNTLDINGELNKLAYNVSFGHGIHAGIHFRSSTYWSILLGEQVALNILQDRAKSYNEPFTINIKKFDGTTATITNQ
ncbi:MAG: phosphoesterase [Acidobacteria bacterium]|nr:MAG: phosphoesterase [Acidobacteriota bacterium]